VGRVLFASKSEPAIDWCEIEFRLHEISTPARSHALPVEPSPTLTHDPSGANDPLVTSDLPVSNFGDPLEMLSLLAAIPSNRS
jgi:hypothetical protein